MKKGNNKFLVVAILLLLVGVVAGTYAIYRSSKTGNASLGTAAWSVKVKGDDIDDTSKTLSFNYSDIHWTKITGKNNKIAPGSEGTISFDVDATGSEVDVDYTVTVGTITGATIGTGFTVTPATTADGTGTIEANAMKKTVTLNVVWTGEDSDDASKDSSDKAMAGKDLTIPVTVTVKQHLA